MKPQTPSQTQLTERAQHLLKVLVESYIRDGQPLGSRTLARAAGLDLSPATIRNVMADLEDLGLIASPHTSSGRVPTPLGYRLFVDSLIKVKPPGSRMIDQMRVELNANLNADTLVKSVSGLLSDVTQLAGIVTVPRREQKALRQIEFLGLSDNRVLAILVMNEHEVQNRILHLDRPHTREELERAANYLNKMFAGKDLGAVRESLLSELNEVRESMNRMMLAAIELGGKALEESEEAKAAYVMAGEANLLGYDELADMEVLRQLFEAFNQKRDILHLLDKSMDAQGVQIFIGQESGYQALDNCSLVTAPYIVDEQTVGVLGVIGPTRIAYERVIPIVDVTAKLLGAALNSRS